MRKEFLRKVGLLVLVAVVSVNGLYATSIGDNAGTTSGEFLRLGAGARATGMGEAFSALANDVYSLYWNPAGLSKVTEKQVLLAHTMWYMDVNHEYAAYVHPLAEGKGALGISITYLMTTFEKRAGDTELADSKGDVGDMALGVSYGRDLKYDIKGGLTAKYISSKLDTEKATGFGFDIGLQRVCPLWEKMDMGLTVTNLGGSLKYVDDSVSIGNMLDLGFAVKEAYFKNLKVALDLRTLLNGSMSSVNAGAEYVWNINDKWSFAPRAGFESYESRITAGFGVGWKVYQLDYAFLSNSDLDNSNRISFNVKF
ncbi:MAG: PorV/PorQ family protein [Elusimicrobia bacterium]|nr:PorV/PorQ family protein [Elusimicrobiota bacterium]